MIPDTRVHVAGTRVVPAGVPKRERTEKLLPRLTAAHRGRSGIDVIEEEEEAGRLDLSAPRQGGQGRRASEGGWEGGRKAERERGGTDIHSLNKTVRLMPKS